MAICLSVCGDVPFIAAIPVLYAANGPPVRQDSESHPPTTNKSNPSAGGKDSWRQSLQSQLSVQWKQVDLKQIVTRADWPGITLWCDRRVDTSQIVDLEIQAQPLQQVISTLAERCQLGLVVHNGVVALVPKNQAEALPVVLADARRQVLDLPPHLGRPWLERQERRWPPLTQPSPMVADWLGLLPKSWKIAGLPHDVWDTGKIPPMALIEQVTFVAFGFGLRPVLAVSDAGPSLTFEPLRSDTNCTMAIEEAFLRTEFRKLKKDFALRYPALTGSFENVPRVSGPLNELGVLLASLEANRPQPGTPKGESRYTIKLEGQPAETVIRFLAQQIKREVTFEPDLPEANLSKSITLNADQWTLEELFRQIGQQADLDFQIDATRIHVRPASNRQ
ncbi:MAG: hypothetical protein Q8M16_17335 [Pirellulaceae bacterium]|nr:hypothetical protein [Pirellulaceae bacterium]